MKENKYFEMKGFYPVWGLFLNGKKEVEKAILANNNDGWNVVQFEWGSARRSVFGYLLILLVTFLTLGFMSYWAGFAVVFEREV